MDIKSGTVQFSLVIVSAHRMENSWYHDLVALAHEKVGADLQLELVSCYDNEESSVVGINGSVQYYTCEIPHLLLEVNRYYPGAAATARVAGDWEDWSTFNLYGDGRVQELRYGVVLMREVTWDDIVPQKPGGQKRGATV